MPRSRRRAIEFATGSETISTHHGRRYQVGLWDRQSLPRHCTSNCIKKDSATPRTGLDIYVCYRCCATWIVSKQLKPKEPEGALDS